MGYPGFDVSRRPFYSKEMDSPEFSKLRKFVTNKRDGEVEATKASLQELRLKNDADSGSDSDSEMVYNVRASVSSKYERSGERYFLSEQVKNETESMWGLKIGRLRSRIID